MIKRPNINTNNYFKKNITNISMILCFQSGGVQDLYEQFTTLESIFPIIKIGSYMLYNYGLIFTFLSLWLRL